MKRSFLACALALVSVASVGCQSSGKHMNDHWNTESVGPRVGRFFLGYNAQKDGEYRDFAYARKQDINMTLRRHLMNHNPDNPNQADVIPTPRPYNSVLPDPVTFFHMEGLLIGFAAYASGGTFAPIPVDSIIGILEPGGATEFMAGINQTFTGEDAGTVSSTSAHSWVTETDSEVMMFNRAGQ